MRPRFILSIIVIIVLLIAVFFWQRAIRNAASPGRIAIESPNNSLSNPPNATGSEAPNVEPPNIQSPTGSSAAVKQDSSKQAVIQQYVDQHNGPVDVYGKFVDQDSNALSGVRIRASILQLTAAPSEGDGGVGSKQIYVDRTSDSDGRFEINGESGKNVYLESIQKDGYELEPGQRNFGNLSGSFGNPVIFKMWSTNIHEKLLTGSYAFKIVPDGRPYFVNLSSGTITEGGSGDLKVWVRYSDQIVSGQSNNWAAEIQVVNGGLVEQPLGTAMYEAPTEGYGPRFQLEGQIRPGQHGQTGERQFYLQLNQGQEYGQMSINLLAPFNAGTPGLIRLSYTVNPSGSRILK
jgi:hypothetical protein